MEKDRLHILIERYFDAETSLAEEKELKRLLADADLSDSAVAEAMAVTGYTAKMSITGEAESVTGCRKISRLWLHAASVVVLLLSAAGPFIWMGRPQEGSGECLAWVGGVKNTDDAVALALMDDQLRGMGEASDELSREVGLDLEMMGNIENIEKEGI